jgi:hypothetical protein
VNLAPLAFTDAKSGSRWLLLYRPRHPLGNLVDHILVRAEGEMGGSWRKEFKELQEFKERSQESESRSREDRGKESAWTRRNRLL